MNEPGKAPVFLERSTYRQRRLRDAVRMLPVLGIILLALPLLSDSALTSSTGVYVFGVWILLICLSAVLSVRIKPEDPSTEQGASGRQD